MEWLGNRHAGEPSPARLLKIPSQKGVGEVGREGVFGAADWVVSSILAERAGGVGAGVGEAHADVPAAVVEAAADLRRHLAIDCRLATVGTAPKFTATFVLPCSM